jgi:hypothetical protein
MRSYSLCLLALVSGATAAEVRVGPGHPHATIQSAVNAAVAGDTIIVNAGTYRERVRITTSNLTIRNAGFDRVLVTGLDVVAGWSDDTGAVDKAPLAIADEALDDTQVFIDGVWMAPATYPNRPKNMLNWSAWGAKISASNTGTVRFFDGMAASSTGLPAGSWAGAIVHFSAGNGWISHQGVVGSHDATTVTCSARSYIWEKYKNWGGFWNNGGGKGYLIQHRNALDTAGEWYWSRDQQRLYVWTPTGTPAARATVEAQTRRWGIVFDGCDDVIVRGIHVRAAGVRAINGADRCQLVNSSVRYGVPFHRTIGKDEHGQTSTPGIPSAVQYSIDMPGADHVVLGSLVSHSWGGGIHLGERGRVEDCLIEDINWANIYGAAVGNAPAPSSLSPGQSDIPGPAGHIVRQSTVRYQGRDAIRPGPSGTYELNDIYGSMGLSRDGGAIYSARWDLLGMRITRNWIHDLDGSVTSLPVGTYAIYADIFADGWLIDRNAIWNTPAGIFLHAEEGKGDSNARIDIVNNTLVQVGKHVESGAVEAVRTINNAVDHDRYLPFGGTTVAKNVVAPATAYRNAAGGDFRLQATATTLLNQGDIVTPYTTGAVGAPDIGAYERDAGTALGRWRPGVRALMPDFGDDLHIRVEAEASLGTNTERLASDLASGRALARATGANATLVFRPAMPAGTYDVHLVHHDEDDGNSTIGLVVGGVARPGWVADWNPGAGNTPAQGNRLTGTWRNVRLTAGQALTITIAGHGAEALCADYLELIPRRLDSERHDPTNLIHNHHGEDTATGTDWYPQARRSWWENIHPSAAGSLLEFGISDNASGLGPDPLIRITPAATTPADNTAYWKLSLSQGKAADPGTTFRISFQARASAARRMTVMWRSKKWNKIYLLRHLDLTTTAATYTITGIAPVTANGEIDRSAELVLAFGQHPAVVWIDDLDMRDDGVNAPIDAPPPAPTSLSATPRP